MAKVLMVMFLAVAVQAAPFPFGRSLFPSYEHQNLAVNEDLLLREVPLDTYAGNEVEALIRSLGPIVEAPVEVLDTPGPSIYDDYRPPASSKAAGSRTLWFETYPHKRAVLDWQNRRIAMGLPTFHLVSQRPGFPFYMGN